MKAGRLLRFLLAVVMIVLIYQYGIARQRPSDEPAAVETVLTFAASGDGVEHRIAYDLASLQERLPVAQFEMDNPFLDGKTVTYEGFHLGDVVALLLETFDVDPASVDPSSRILFSALDGYKISLTFETLADPATEGLIAYREAGRTDGKDWEIFTDQGREIDPAPFWLIWRDADPDHESRDAAWLVENRPWPYMLVQIELVD